MLSSENGAAAAGRIFQAPLREQVGERLEQLIIDGAYAPGEHLVETDLAVRLGVSRGPIREALHQLHRQGWVELRPRHGAFVHSPTIDEVHQYFQVRSLLEGQAAELAAEHADPESIDMLRQQIAGARAAIRTGDEETLARSSEPFHGRIAELSGNVILEQLIELVDKRVRWYVKPLLLEQANEAWDQHEGIVDALDRGDTATAGALMREHIDFSQQAFLRRRTAQG